MTVLYTMKTEIAQNIKPPEYKFLFYVDSIMWSYKNLSQKLNVNLKSSNLNALVLSAPLLSLQNKRSFFTYGEVPVLLQAPDIINFGVSKLF